MELVPDKKWTNDIQKYAFPAMYRIFESVLLSCVDYKNAMSIEKPPFYSFFYRKLWTSKSRTNQTEQTRLTTSSRQKDKSNRF